MAQKLRDKQHSTNILHSTALISSVPTASLCYYCFLLRNIRRSSSSSSGVHPDLLSCMNRVYLRGCEAEYFSPLIRSLDFCEPSAPTEGRSFSASGLDKAVEAISNLKANHLVLRRELDSGEPALDPPTPGQSSAGSLIIHIRSGDIFKRRNTHLAGANFPGFGQVNK